MQVKCFNCCSCFLTIINNWQTYNMLLHAVFLLKKCMALLPFVFVSLKNWNRGIVNMNKSVTFSRAARRCPRKLPRWHGGARTPRALLLCHYVL